MKTNRHLKSTIIEQIAENKRTIFGYMSEYPKKNEMQNFKENKASACKEQSK